MFIYEVAVFRVSQSIGQSTNKSNRQSVSILVFQSVDLVEVIPSPRFYDTIIKMNM